MLLRHRTGAFIRPAPYTYGDCWVARDVLFKNEYGITADMVCNRVVDVGAHIGCFARKVLELHPNAQIACVEPLHEVIECLRANAPSARVFHAALAWQREAEVHLYAPREEVYSAFQQGTGVSAHHSQYAHFIPHCTAPAVTLQHVLDAMQWDNADLLKLDCEMAEFQAFDHLDELVKFRIIRGEYHDLGRMQRMVPVLDKQFVVTMSDTEPRGHFWMERRR